MAKYNYLIIFDLNLLRTVKPTRLLQISHPIIKQLIILLYILGLLCQQIHMSILAGPLVPLTTAESYTLTVRTEREKTVITKEKLQHFSFDGQLTDSQSHSLRTMESEGQGE